VTVPLHTGVDLSKILGEQTKILGGQKVVKVINAWAFLNYWGAHARAALQSLCLFMFIWKSTRYFSLLLNKLIRSYYVPYNPQVPC